MAELPPRRNARKPPTRSFDDGAFCLSWQYVRAKMYVPKCSTHMHGCGGHSISKLFIFTICWCRTLTATASMTPACASFQSARSQPLDDEGREAGRVVIAALRSLAAIVWTSVFPLFLPVLEPLLFWKFKLRVHALAAACARESWCVCTTVCDVARVRRCAYLSDCKCVCICVSAFVCLRVSNQTAWSMHPDPCARARARARTHTHTQAQRSVYFGSEFVANKKKLKRRGGQYICS
jgi:hypothetical protein